MSTLIPVEVIAEALAEHQPYWRSWDGEDEDDSRPSCTCGIEEAWSTEHQASVIAALPDIAIVNRESIARGMFLKQAQSFVHPDDLVTPEEQWDTGFDFKSLWFAEADQLLAALAVAGGES